MSKTVSITQEDPEEALFLLNAHHALMESLFPSESNHYLKLDDLRKDHIRFFTARIDGQVMGCGALSLQGSYGEVKSMHVGEAARGQGIAKALLDRLILEAKRQHLPLLRLETGNKLEAAHALYKQAGFVMRGPFGDYRDDPNSLFMELRLL